MQTTDQGEALLSLIVGGWHEQEGTLSLLDQGEVATRFSLNWEIDVLACASGQRLALRRLDLVAQPVELPGGCTGILSFTTPPQIAGLYDLFYEEESGEFSTLAPLLVHVPLADETPSPPKEEDGCCGMAPRRFLAVARFEGRFRDRPGRGAASERPLEIEVEVRGLAVRPGEPQEWDALAPRIAVAMGSPWQGPPRIEPPFEQARPAFEGFVVRSLGTATEFPIPVCQYHTPRRQLTIQPVFVDARGPDPLDPDRLHPVRDLPWNPHVPGSLPVADVDKISGKSFETVMQRAKEIWGKVCLELEVLPPKAVRDEDFFALGSGLEASHFSQWVKPDGKSILVFVASRWNLTGQTVSVKIVVAQIEHIRSDFARPLSPHRVSPG